MEQRTLLSAVAVSWTGAVSSDWDTPGNWSDDAVPGQGDDVTINVSTNTPVTHATNVDDTINSLTSSEPLTISEGALAMATASTISNTLTITGTGTFGGAGNITVGGLLTISNGTISGTGTLTANGGIDISVNGTDVVVSGETLVNPAGQTATWTGGQSGIAELDGADIVNDGTFNLEAAGTLTDQGNTGAPVSFTNDGTFTSSSGSFIVLGVAFNVTSPTSPTSTATVAATTGILEIEGGGASSGGVFTADAGATLDIGGTYTLDGSSTISGAGNVGFANSYNVTMVGTYDVSGTTAVTQATVTFTGPVTSLGSTLTTLNGSADFSTASSFTAGTIPTLTLNGGTLNFGANPLTLTTLTVNYGTLEGSGNITVSGLTTLDGQGALTGSGTITANGGTSIDIYDAGPTIDGKTFVNPAGQTVTWTGSDSGILLVDGGDFVNDGTFQLTTAGASALADTGNPGAAVAFTNNGTFLFDNSGQVFAFLGVAFNTTTPGTVDVQNGEVRLEGGGTETSAAFTIGSGGTLDFEGGGTSTLAAGTTITGAGTVAVSGFETTVIISGNIPSFTGPTNVTAGTLLVDGSLPNSAVAVTQGTLGGSGTVGPLTSSGIISPGTPPATGILTAQGNVTMNSPAIFQVALQGSAPGTGFDQLAVTGTANITGSTLSASLSGFTPSSGETFPIITSTAPIVGTFAGLTQGATVTIGSIPFTISYLNDDVTLTAPMGGRLESGWKIL